MSFVRPVRASQARITVLHVITSLDTGGAEMMLYKLLKTGSSETWQSAVLSLSHKGPVGSRIEALGVPIFTLGIGPGGKDIARAAAFARTVRQLRPALIQGWMYYGSIAATLAGFSLLGRSAVVWTLRQGLDDLSVMRPLTRGMVRFGAHLSRYPRAIIYNSETGAAHHEAIGYYAGRRVVIPNGFDWEEFRPSETSRHAVRAELGIDQEAPLIGLFGTFHPVKGHLSFLQAARITAQARDDVRFLLVGRGTDAGSPKLAALIAEYGLQGRVVTLGEQSDMPRLTAALDVACSASLNEGFANVIGEAMACGVPCVVTNVGDSARAVADTGIVVPPRRPEALADALGRMVELGPDGRRRLGAAARQRVIANYSLQEIARRYHEVYAAHIRGEPRETLGAPSPSPRVERINVWMVISSYRNDESVLRLLDTVRASGQCLFDRILIVDSEGTGVIPGVLKKRGWSDVEYRCYDYNIGSGGNLRERLRIAAENGADYVWAINHDGTFDAGVVASLLKTASAIKNLGAAYPLSHAGTVDAYNLTGTRELPLPAKLVPERPRAAVVDAFWSSSNGALYSMQPVRCGILPWSEMWMGWEDLEYGWRLSDHGYRQVIVSEAVYRDDFDYLQTWVGRTPDKPAWRSYYYARNLILAIRRTRNRPLYYAVAAYRLLRECTLIVLAKDSKLKRLRLIVGGTIDALRWGGWSSIAAESIERSDKDISISS